MKAGYPYGKSAGKFPLIPVIGGGIVAGTFIYFATAGKEENNPDDCTFSASATPTGATCGLSNGSVNLTLNPQASYMYQWSTGASPPTLNNIPAGSYSVTV